MCVFTIQISFSRIQWLLLHTFYFYSRQTSLPWKQTKQISPLKKKKNQNQNPPKQAQNKQAKPEKYPQPVSKNEIYVGHLLIFFC